MAEDAFPFTQRVRRLPATVPFVGPEALERRQGRLFDVRIGANESAFGISPRARQAMQQEIERISWYNDPENYDLREALARLHGVPLTHVSVGAGIDDLLGLMVRACVEPGDTVVTSRGAYPTFHYHVEGYGGTLHVVPYRHDANGLQGLLDAVVQTGSRLVFLANPDNPTGSWHTAPDIQLFVDRLPPGCLLILDEAYSDFAPPEAIPPIVSDETRVIRMRTFSKAHGMAGARVGYALAAPEVVTAFDKLRLHFGVNRIAQVGALASLQDTAFVQGVVQAVQQGRQEYATLARDLGQAARAQTLLDRLIKRGVFVRKSNVPPLDRCVRVTVGTPAERRRFAEVLREVLHEVGR